MDSERTAPGPLELLDRWRGRFGLVLAPLAAVLTWHSVEQARAPVAALFVVAGVLWVSEAVHPAVTALLVVALAPLLGACSAKEAFSALGNPVLFLFVGSFMIAEAMRLHGLGDRLAHALSERTNGRLGALVATSSSAFLMSMWISNAAATAVVLPIVLSLGRSLGDDAAARRYRSALVLGVAWASSMGGLCTPVGTPPNLIGMRAMRELGLGIDFIGWMRIATPMALLMLVAMWVVLAVVFGIRPGQPAPRPPPIHVRWRAGEVAATCAFAVAIVGWTVPGVLDALGHPAAGTLRARLPEEVTALLAATILFVWPIREADGAKLRRALTWQDAARIDWGTVILFGGGILLGDLANKSGLARVWGEALMELSGAQSAVAITALVTIAAVVLSELASNTAAATLMIPLAIGLADAAQIDRLPPLLGATLGASFGFMMPISTAPNAMAYATGEVTIRQMIRAGVLFDVVGAVVIIAVLALLF